MKIVKWTFSIIGWALLYSAGWKIAIGVLLVSLYFTMDTLEEIYE